MEEVAYTEAFKNHSTKSHTQGQLQNTCRLEKDVKESHQDQNDQVNIIKLFPKFYLYCYYYYFGFSRGYEFVGKHPHT